MRCPSHDRALVPSDDEVGVRYLWPDETPFDPQPVAWKCSVTDCQYGVLIGLTWRQRLRLQALKQQVHPE